jgi:hypothetical protein
MKKIQLITILLGTIAFTMHSCSKDEIKGCTDGLACNFNPEASEDNGTCTYEQTWMQDLNGDGLGNPFATLIDCNQPAGYVLNPCVVNTYYQDLDGDGLGNPNVTTQACDSVVGYVSNSDDDADFIYNQVQVPIIFKITGETCSFCGDWGWQAWIDLADDFAGNAFCWGNYGNGFSDNTFRSEELDPANTVADAMENMFETGTGKPNFATNGVDYDVSSNDAKNAATLSLSSVPNVGIIFTSSLSGSLLTINAGAKFYAAETGEYWMGAYVVENHAVGPQAGPNGNAGNNGNDVQHHLVMRGSMSNSPWGVQVVASSIAAGVDVGTTFSVSIPANYVQSNLTYGVIVWKKVGTSYQYVNAATNQ